MRRKNANEYHTFSDETICCPVAISGLSPDSGHNLGSDGKAKLAFFSPDQERFLGRSREGVPDSRSGLIIGEFLDQKVSRQTTLESRGLVAKTPLFSRIHFLSGIDSGRVLVIRA